MCSRLCNTYYYILYNLFGLPIYIDEPNDYNESSDYNESNDYNEYLVKSKMNIIENPIYIKR